MKKPRRVISKSKMYGFNPWMDQLDAVNQLIAETGEKESTVLRKLIDEALIARRQGSLKELEEPARTQAEKEKINTIARLLVVVLEQLDKAMRVHDVSLALSQDILAESRAGRRSAWEQLSAVLKERGLSKREIDQRFDAETNEALDFAYAWTKEIKLKQDAELLKMGGATKELLSSNPS